MNPSIQLAGRTTAYQQRYWMVVSRLRKFSFSNSSSTSTTNHDTSNSDIGHWDDGIRRTHRGQDENLSSSPSLALSHHLPARPSTQPSICRLDKLVWRQQKQQRTSEERVSLLGAQCAAFRLLQQYCTSCASFLLFISAKWLPPTLKTASLSARLTIKNDFYHTLSSLSFSTS